MYISSILTIVGISYVMSLGNGKKNESKTLIHYTSVERCAIDRRGDRNE